MPRISERLEEFETMMDKLIKNSSKDVKDLVKWIKKHRRLVVFIIGVYLVFNWLFAEE